LPELPEVETVVRGLRAAVVGRRITDVRFGKTDFIADPAALVRLLPGCRIAGVARRGKFVVLRLERMSPPNARATLLIHLGMTGQIVVGGAAAPVSPHTHVFVALDDGRELRYTDVRRFGRISLVSDAQLPENVLRLGPDPLEITAGEFQKRIGGRRAMIKALLLDQSVLAGLGNIYVDETLWRARVHPQRLAVRLRSQELLRLHRTMRDVLREAVRLRGSSVSDYVDAEGQRGDYQQRHRVYQREGKRCFRCGAAIRRVVVAGRSSFFCPRCQRAPRRHRGRRGVG